MHLKHVANGRPSRWNPFCGTKNASVLKHSQPVRQVGSSMKSALIHTFERVC